MKLMTPFLLFPAMAAVAAPPPTQARMRPPVNTPREAKAIAEHRTGGIAVSARRIPLNGATGGWEVDVHMPGETRGWRCIVDNDTHMVHTRTRIPNPRAPKSRR